MNIAEQIAESQRREAYRQGRTDGELAALLAPRPVKVFGKALQGTLTWPDGPPPQDLIDGALRRVAEREAANGPVCFAADASTGQ